MRGLESTSQARAAGVRVYCPLSCFALQPAECMPMAYLSRQPPSPTCTCTLHAPALPILYCLLPPAVYTRGLSKQAASLIYQYLPRAYSEGASDYLAREKVRASLCVWVCILSVNAFRKKKNSSCFTNACYLVITFSSAPCAAHNTLLCPIRQKQQMHYAACIAGMAFSNTMLGVAHSMAATIGAKYKAPHGLALAPLLPAVILFNAAGSEQVQTGLRVWCGGQVWESQGHVSLRYVAAACCSCGALHLRLCFLSCPPQRPQRSTNELASAQPTCAGSALPSPPQPLPHHPWVLHSSETMAGHEELADTLHLHQHPYSQCSPFRALTVLHPRPTLTCCAPCLFPVGCSRLRGASRQPAPSGAPPGPCTCSGACGEGAGAKGEGIGGEAGGRWCPEEGVRELRHRGCKAGGKV